MGKTIWGIIWSAILVILAPVLLVIKQREERKNAELRALKEMTSAAATDATSVPAWRRQQSQREAESAAERAAEAARRERIRERQARRPIRVPRDPGGPPRRTRRQHTKTWQERLSEWWKGFKFPRPHFNIKAHFTWEATTNWLSWGLRYVVIVLLPAILIPAYILPYLSGTVDVSTLYLIEIVMPLSIIVLGAIYGLMARRSAGDVADESRLVSHVRGQEARSRFTRAILPHDTPANRIAYVFMWIELVQVCAFAFKDSTPWPTKGVLTVLYRITLLDFSGTVAGLMATWAIIWTLILLWIFVLSVSIHYDFKPANSLGFRLLAAALRGPLVLPIMNATFLATICSPNSSILSIADSGTQKWTCWGRESSVLGSYVPPSVVSHTAIATIAYVLSFGLYLPSMFILTIRRHGKLSLMPDDVVDAWDEDDGELERIGLLYCWSGRFIAADCIMKTVLALISTALLHASTPYIHLLGCAVAVILLILTSIRFPPTTVKVANLLRMFLYVASLYCYACAALAHATVTDESVASVVGTDPGEKLVLSTDNWWPLILLVYGWTLWAIVFFLRAKVTTQNLYRRMVGLD